MYSKKLSIHVWLYRWKEIVMDFEENDEIDIGGNHFEEVTPVTDNRWAYGKNR